MKIIKEQDWDGGRYDWHLMSPKEGSYDCLVVSATNLVRSPGADIVAVWLDAYKKPIYLVSRNRELYYHDGFDEILEQYFPARDFLRWRNSWEYTDMPFTAMEPFPEGWQYLQCYPHISKTFILIREDLWNTFSEVLAEHDYKYFYHVSCDFPVLMDKILERFNNTVNI